MPPGDDNRPRRRRPVAPEGAAPHDHQTNKFGPKRIDGRLTRSEQQAIRLAAKLYYTLDLDGVSVQQMAQMPQFCGVGVATLNGWARAENWEAERQDVRLRWANELKRRLSEQLVHHSYEEMMQLKQLSAQAYMYAMPGEDGTGPAPPRTFVEAAKIFLQIDQALGGRRDRLLDGVMRAAEQTQAQASPAGASAQTPDARMVPQMTEDEYQELAHALIANRLRATAAKDTSASSEDT